MVEFKVVLITSSLPVSSSNTGTSTSNSDTNTGTSGSNNDALSSSSTTTITTRTTAGSESSTETTTTKQHNLREPIENVELLVQYLLQQQSIIIAIKDSIVIQVQESLFLSLNNDDNNKTNTIIKIITATYQSIQIQQFGYGQSNPTYRIDFQFTIINTNNDSREIKIHVPFVLRTKPKSIAHPTAHAIDREYRILYAINLYNKNTHTSSNSSNNNNNIVPVPKVYVYCTKSSSIIHREFYIMEYLNGRIFTNPLMIDTIITNKVERYNAYVSITNVLSNLHSINIHSRIPIPDSVDGIDYTTTNNSTSTSTSTGYNTISIAEAVYGISAGTSSKTKARSKTNTDTGMSYVERQIHRLINVCQHQSKLANEVCIPDELVLIEQRLLKLSTIIKKYYHHSNNYTTTNNNNNNNNNNSSLSCLIHGDFKIDNLLFHPTQSIVIGIIDWELATIGDPLCDVANLCMMYYTPKSNNVSLPTTRTGSTDTSIGTTAAIVTSSSSTSSSEGTSSNNNDTDNGAMVGFYGLSQDYLTQQLGIPCREDVIKLYCEAYIQCQTKQQQQQNQRDNNYHTTTDTSINNISKYFSNNDNYYYKYSLFWSYYYLSFLFFKNSVIVHGVAQRVKTGTATSTNAKKVALLLPKLLSLCQLLLSQQEQQLLQVTLDVEIDNKQPQELTVQRSPQSKL